MSKSFQLHIIPEYTIGEICKCGAPATHKVEEVIESPARHPFTQYLCCLHFSGIFGLDAQESCGLTPRPPDALCSCYMPEIYQLHSDSLKCAKCGKPARR